MQISTNANPYPLSDGSSSSLLQYYFGDMNLSRDKFLRDLNGKEDGWIPIQTLLTFNRLKALTEKPAEVAAAFEDNQSELIELNEAKDKLRRSVPLVEQDEKYKTDLNLRTIHFKGFPKEDTTLDELIEFSAQYGEVEHVNMRRLADKKFKVSVTFRMCSDIVTAQRSLVLFGDPPNHSLMNSLPVPPLPGLLPDHLQGDRKCEQSSGSERQVQRRSGNRFAREQVSCTDF